MSSKPVVGIMVNKRSQRKRTLRLYQKYKGNIPVELFSFTPKNIDWKSKRIKGCSFRNQKWETTIFRFPDAVYNRCYQKKGKTIKRLEKYIGKNKCFNTITFFNKWELYKILSITDLNAYLPRTWVYQKKRFKNLLEIRKQLILKSCYGYLGRRVYLVEAKTDDQPYKVYQDTLKRPKYIFEDAAPFYKKIDELTSRKQHIVQEYVPSERAAGRIADIRMLVQKNSKGKWAVTNGISRIAQKDYYVTNCSNRICLAEEVLSLVVKDTKEQHDLYEIMIQMSIKMSKLIEKHLGILGEIGIDMVIDENKNIKIIEVNGKLQKNLYHKVRETFPERELVYKRPIEYAYFLASKKTNKEL
ncbi:YheC/YheD family protein [Alteribacillus sp. JSM 102045]|uniref:YheC/YheD family protein n=1 Tax=Alteribacillus sp. JSM 102045 TaxID=1562101 RepID=UPI0035C21DFD